MHNIEGEAQEATAQPSQRREENDRETPTVDKLSPRNFNYGDPALMNRERKRLERGIALMLD
jgi:hypothetical protein